MREGGRSHLSSTNKTPFKSVKYSVDSYSGNLIKNCVNFYMHFRLPFHVIIGSYRIVRNYSPALVFEQNSLKANLEMNM